MPSGKKYRPSQPYKEQSSCVYLFYTLLAKLTNTTQALTKGSILAMSKSQDCGKPIVQVLDVKQIQGPNNQTTQPERFR